MTHPSKKRNLSELEPDEGSSPPQKKQNTTTSYESCFRTDLFDLNTSIQLQYSYAKSEPYPHAVIPGLVSAPLLQSVRNEIQTHVSFTLKETDIYRIHQSGDLANLSNLDSDSLSHLPSLLQLRNALYSEKFRGLISSITGTGKLSGRKTDMAVNVYTPGSYLLCHDDVIGSRKVSYILYLTDPEKPWKPEWGGGLRLYPTQIRTNQKGEQVKLPLPDHTLNIPPSFGQLSFFAVRPGESFHDVEEVHHRPPDSEEDDGGRIRMAISGWYHIPQDGEDGYEFGLEEKSAHNSSLAQLQGGGGDEFDEPQERFVPFHRPRDKSKPDDHRGRELQEDRSEISSTRKTIAEVHEKLSSHDGATADETDEGTLTEEDLTFLLDYISPSYLTPDMAQNLSASFTEDSFLQLNDFLRPNFAQSLRNSVAGHDASDPPKLNHDESNPWRIARPPHKHRYLFLSSSDWRCEKPQDNHGQGGLTAPENVLLATLLPSHPFRKWLGLITGLGGSNLSKHNTMIRRFRRGKDYALASTYAGDHPRLEYTLGMTPTGGWEDIDNAADSKGQESFAGVTDGVNGHNPQGPASRSTRSEHIEVGGEEVYMAGDDDDDDNSVHLQPLPRVGNQSKADPAVYRSAKDDEEDDGILFTSPACWNRFSVVLRDRGTMRFVKYVSHAAKGDRWDISGLVELSAEAFADDDGQSEAEDAEGESGEDDIDELDDDDDEVNEERS